MKVLNCLPQSLTVHWNVILFYPQGSVEILIQKLKSDPNRMHNGKGPEDMETKGAQKQ